MYPNNATAQNNIVNDDTLGTENSVVTEADGTTDEISGGATRGVNLFHSFREFNIGRDNARLHKH